MKTTVYNYMWNLSDPILTIAEKFAPNMVRSLNIGILDTVSITILNTFFFSDKIFISKLC